MLLMLKDSVRLLLHIGDWQSLRGGMTVSVGMWFLCPYSRSCLRCVPPNPLTKQSAGTSSSGGRPTASTTPLIHADLHAQPRPSPLSFPPTRCRTASHITAGAGSKGGLGGAGRAELCGWAGLSGDLRTSSSGFGGPQRGACPLSDSVQTFICE